MKPEYENRLEAESIIEILRKAADHDMYRPSIDCGETADLIESLKGELAEKDKRIVMKDSYLQSIKAEMEAADCCKCDLDVLIKDAEIALQLTTTDVDEWFKKVKSDERKKVYAKIDREETESIAYCIGSKAGHFVEGGRCQTGKKDWIPKSRISSATEESSDA